VNHERLAAVVNETKVGLVVCILDTVVFVVIVVAAAAAAVVVLLAVIVRVVITSVVVGWLGDVVNCDVEIVTDPAVLLCSVETPAALVVPEVDATF
jgi:hypothetical protein